MVEGSDWARVEVTGLWGRRAWVRAAGGIEVSVDSKGQMRQAQSREQRQRQWQMFKEIMPGFLCPAEISAGGWLSNHIGCQQDKIVLLGIFCAALSNPHV